MFVTSCEAPGQNAGGTMRQRGVRCIPLFVVGYPWRGGSSSSSSRHFQWAGHHCWGQRKLTHEGREGGAADLIWVDFSLSAS